MNRIFRFATALSVMCLSVGIAARADVPNSSPPSVSQNGNVQVGVGVICNSSTQVQRYLAVKTSASSEDAILAVNRETRDEHACGMAMIAFMAGERTAEVNVDNGLMHVTQITIVAVATDGGWKQVPATTQYTAFFEKAISI
jgi:hypothetical protein